MRKFNLEEYSRDPRQEVVTRNGRPVRILCTDVNSPYYPIIALVDMGGREEYWEYTRNGNVVDAEECGMDLRFARTRHEGWINIALGSDSVFPTEAEAKKHLKTNGVKTVKIEWEE